MAAADAAAAAVRVDSGAEGGGSLSPLMMHASSPEADPVLQIIKNYNIKR